MFLELYNVRVRVHQVTQDFLTMLLLDIDACLQWMHQKELAEECYFVYTATFPSPSNSFSIC